MDSVENDLHFTYNEVDTENASLKQGDILEKTPQLIQLLEEVHPHYAKPDYKFFQVITQSCDLVRRGNKCKSRYITLAAVRQLDDIIDRFIADNASPVFVDGNPYCSEKEGRVYEFLKKLFNNNEKEYFFLEKSPKHGISVHCCTLLYLSIAIRAYEHYDLCLNAKRLELKDNFQSKLGWLVGNLYSRVGTDDYVPAAIGNEKDFKEILKKIVTDHAVWVPQVRFPEFKKVASENNEFDYINDIIEERLEKKKASKLSSILQRLNGAIALSEEDEKKISNLIQQDPLFSKLLS